MFAKQGVWKDGKEPEGDELTKEEKQSIVDPPGSVFNYVSRIPDLKGGSRYVDADHNYRGPDNPGTVTFHKNPPRKDFYKAEMWCVSCCGQSKGKK